jgi:hypothetical protein
MASVSEPRRDDSGLSGLKQLKDELYSSSSASDQDGALHFQGEAIELNPENSRKVAAAVAELRRAIPKKTATPELLSLMRELKDATRDRNLQERIVKLDQCCNAIVEEFEEVSRDKGLGLSRMLFNSTLTKVHGELERIVVQNGLA